LCEFFGVAQVVANQCHDNHTEDLIKVRSSGDDACHWHHLTRGGLIESAQIAEAMNRRKPRTELIGILRDYTPDARDIG
jgi:hypothetical protein